VILLTFDGLRHQELFGGADCELASDKESSGVESLEPLLEEFGGGSPDERRRVLMPFFWGELAPRGIVLGNRSKGSQVLLRNPHKFSYPGYAELLTGQVQPLVSSNAKRRIPRTTVLEYVAKKLELPSYRVAVIASWDVFPYIVAADEQAVFCNAGYAAMPDRWCSERALSLNRWQFEMLTPWDSVRHDAVTVELAISYLERARPRFLYVALGETDDWAHERRYDRVLAAIRACDDALRRIWSAVESIEEYRDTTTLVVTTDHGRGRGAKDWTDHKASVPGSEEIWLAVVGPDTPDLGEVSDHPTAYLSDVAATILDLMGLDPHDFNPDAGPAVRPAQPSSR
jgi:hypothetical protein